MGLNPRGRGRGGKGRRGGGMAGPGPMFRGPPGMFGPPMGFPPGPPPFGPPFFGRPCGSNFGPRRPPGYGKFPRKNFRGRNQQRNNDSQALEIDLTKPWVTEQIKSEEAKKQECLETWRKSKDDSDWNKYKEQKQTVQNLYNKAKAEYLENKPEEAGLWHEAIPMKDACYCEACDKSLKDEKSLYLHQMEHETCGRDGCEYTAHPKLVAKHMRMQHDTGLYKRIGKLNTEEEITRWLEERKRKYPTKKMVEEKKMLQEEKLKRGERINEDESKFNKSFTGKKDTPRKGTRFEKKIRRNRKSRLREKRVKEVKEMAVSEALKEENSWRGSVPPFSGIRVLYDIELPGENEEEKFSDQEWETTDNAEATTNSIENIKNSLDILASYYGSDEDFCEVSKPSDYLEHRVSDNEDAPEEVNTICIKEGVSFVQKDKDKKCSDENRIKRGRRKRRNEDFGKENMRSEFCSNKKRKLTLLEKLLSKEIRQERNIILQCVRYVIKNNFFID